MDLLILIISLAIAFTTGTIIEKNHFKKIRAREKRLIKFPAVSFETKAISSKKKVKKMELVSECVVVSGDYFKTWVSSFRNFFGGRMISYESLADRARREAILRIREKALGSDLIANLRLETSILSDSSTGAPPQVAILAYGTAITYENTK